MSLEMHNIERGHSPSIHVEDDCCSRNACNELIAWSILFLFVGVVLVCITVPLSFWYIPFDQVGFIQDRYGNVDTSTALSQGRYFLPLTKSVVLLPITYQPIQFVSPVFSQSGLEFNLNISFNYRLTPDTAGQIYNKYSTNYEAQILAIAKANIKNAAPQFGVDDYSIHKSEIQGIFALAVSSQVSSEVAVEVPMDQFMLLDVVFPDSVLESSLASALQQQTNQINGLTQQVVVIESDTARLVAEINAETNLTLAYALTQSGQIVANSVSRANAMVTQARGDGIESALAMLGVTNSSIKTDFIRLSSILDNGNSRILSGPIGSVYLASSSI